MVKPHRKIETHCSRLVLILADCDLRNKPRWCPSLSSSKFQASIVLDSNGPDITFGDQPTDTQSSPTFTWSSSEPARFKCRMENSFEEVDCGRGTYGLWTGNKIPDGPHKFLVYGMDKMNNRGPVAELEFNVGE